MGERRRVQAPHAAVQEPEIGGGGRGPEVEGDPVVETGFFIF